MITISSDEEEDGEESVIPQPQSQSAQSKDRPIFHTASPPSPALFSDSEDEEQQHVERLRLPQEITTPAGSKTVGGCHVDIYKTSDSHIVLPSGGDPSNHQFRKSQVPLTFSKSSPCTPDYGSAATRTSHAVVTLSTGLPPVSSPLGSYAEAHTQSQIRVSLSAESPHAPIGDTDIHSQESAGIPTYPSQVSSQPHHQHCGPQIAQVYGNIGTGSRGDIQMLAGQSLNFAHTGHNLSPKIQVFTGEDGDENQVGFYLLNDISFILKYCYWAGLGIGRIYLIDNQSLPIDQLPIIIGSSHFFGNWALEVLCRASKLLQHAAALVFLKFLKVFLKFRML